MAVSMGGRDRLDSLLTRRAFLGLVVEGAIVIGLAGFIRFLGRKDSFIRPPGARPEEEFLSLCIRCGKCREACPWGLITLVPLTESVISVGTPRLRWPCPHCMRCIRVCPTGALR
ncbi:MAG: 4Fe-4S dicluster domain-containing protein [Chloroflexi bacterium]|nr:4Fe-4S dicluster domain-containing protein [Chloroflexota bacterium]